MPEATPDPCRAAVRASWRRADACSQLRAAVGPWITHSNGRLGAGRVAAAMTFSAAPTPSCPSRPRGACRLYRGRAPLRGGCRGRTGIRHRATSASPDTAHRYPPSWSPAPWSAVAETSVRHVQGGARAPRHLALATRAAVSSVRVVRAVHNRQRRHFAPNMLSRAVTINNSDSRRRVVRTVARTTTINDNVSSEPGQVRRSMSDPAYRSFAADLLQAMMVARNRVRADSERPTVAWSLRRSTGAWCIVQ